MFGGNRSGKTEAGAAEVVLHMAGSQDHRYRKRQRNGTCWAVSESSEIQREVVQPKLLKFIPKHWIKKTQMIQRGIIDFMLVENDKGDQWRIMFKNYEQGVDKFGGKDVDIVWFDEEPPHDIYIECKMRTIDRGGRIIGTMTPVSGMTWVFQEVWEKDGTNGIRCFMMDMDQNPYLGEREKNLALAGLTNEERQIRKEGKFVALHGLVYPQFKEDKHVIQPFEVPRDWKKVRVCSIDSHLAKPTSVLWGVMAEYDSGPVSRGDWVIYRELRRNGVIPDISASVLASQGRAERPKYIADPALNMKDNITGVSPFDEFANCGLPLIPANKRVESGIYAVRELLDMIPSGIYIFSTCIGLIWEFRHYVFADIQTDKKKPYSEKIKKRDDDYMDCLRYIINGGWRLSNGDPHMGKPVYSKTGRLMGVRPNA